MKAQPLLRREQLRTALSKISALARHSNVQEATSKLPQLVERMQHFYQGSPWARARQARKSRQEDLILALDRITTRGLALKAGFDEEAREQWELDIIDWLSHGETLLRDNFPEHFRELTVFAARVSPYSDRPKLEQVISERLRVLGEIGKRRRSRSGAPREPIRGGAPEQEGVPRIPARRSLIRPWSSGRA